MTTNQHPKKAPAIMMSIAVTAFLLAFVLLFGSCVAGNSSRYNHFKEEGRYQDKRLMKHIADSLYKVGDSSCLVMKKDGRWCLACKDSLKIR